MANPLSLSMSYFTFEFGQENTHYSQKNEKEIIVVKKLTGRHVYYKLLQMIINLTIIAQYFLANLDSDRTWNIEFTQLPLYCNFKLRFHIKN